MSRVHRVGLQRVEIWLAFCNACGGEAPRFTSWAAADRWAQEHEAVSRQTHMAHSPVRSHSPSSSVDEPSSDS